MRIVKDGIYHWTKTIGRGYFVFIELESEIVIFRSNCDYKYRNGIYGKYRSYILKLGRWCESNYTIHTNDYKFVKKIIRYLIENPKLDHCSLFRYLSISKQEADSLERVAKLKESEDMVQSYEKS